MDYTKIPRELIYYDRLSIDELKVDVWNSLDCEIFNQIMRLGCIDPTKEETEPLILKIINDAYYILTMFFLEKNPVFRFNQYQSIAKEDPYYLQLSEKEYVVFSIVRGVLKPYEKRLGSNKLLFCEKIDEYLENLKKKIVFGDREIYISERDTRNEHNNFTPRVITEDLARQIDWMTLTNNFNLDEIKNIVNGIGNSTSEKIIIIKAIYAAASDTGNMTLIPYDVDETLNQLSKIYILSKLYDEKRKRFLGMFRSHEEIGFDDKTSMGQRNDKIISPKAQTKELEEQLKAAKELDEKRIEEIKKLEESFKHAKDEASKWKQKYEKASKDCKEAEHERDIYKDTIGGAGAKKYTVRQTSIIAYALCKKADVMPTNKKNISQLFNGISGYSSNSMIQNLCSSYSDEEIEAIAASVEKEMPGFAKYLRQKTFFLPEMKK